MICSSNVYGGTFNLFGVTMKKMGVDVTFVDPEISPEDLEKEFKPNTKCEMCIRDRCMGIYKNIKEDLKHDFKGNKSSAYS